MGIMYEHRLSNIIGKIRVLHCLYLCVDLQYVYNYNGVWTMETRHTLICNITLQLFITFFNFVIAIALSAKWENVYAMLVYLISFFRSFFSICSIYFMQKISINLIISARISFIYLFLLNLMFLFVVVIKSKWYKINVIHFYYMFIVMVDIRYERYLEFICPEILFTPFNNNNKKMLFFEFIDNSSHSAFVMWMLFFTKLIGC